MKDPVVTSVAGDSADIFVGILKMYVPKGSTVADVTFGKGAFWRKAKGTYLVLKSDLARAPRHIDFRSLPYEDGSIDALVIDPPYMQGGSRTASSAVYKVYKNFPNTYHGLIRLYAGGFLEAARVLRPDGKLIVKCQDQVRGGKQHWVHLDLLVLMGKFGFELMDLFVLTQKRAPLMRHDHQEHARKNHSYFVVGSLKK